MSDNPAFADLDAKIRRSSDGPKQNQPPRRSESREILHVSGHVSEVLLCWGEMHFYILIQQHRPETVFN